jgi:hypothetical protein
VTGFEKRGHLEQNKKIDICYHFEANNEEHNTVCIKSISIGCGVIVD